MRDAATFADEWDEADEVDLVSGFGERNDDEDEDGEARCGRPDAVPADRDASGDGRGAREASGPSAGPERIRTLLGEVGALAPVFEGMVDFCREPRTPAACDERFAKLTEHNRSTYSPVRVRALLEEAGALTYVEDTPAVEPAALEADDGCYPITVRPEGLWAATAAGIEVLDGRDRAGELRELAATEPEFAVEYEKVLEALLGGGKTMAELSELVDGDAPMVEQHRFAPFLVKRLEERGAVVFEGLWTITDVGESALAELVENEARGAR